MTCSFIAVPSAWPSAGLPPLHGWGHRTQPGRGPGAREGGGRFWLLLVVANQLQKGEPMSSPAWHLHFPFFPSHFHTHGGGIREGGEKLEWVKEHGCGDHCLPDSANTSWSLLMGQVPCLQRPEVARGGRLPWATTKGTGWRSCDFLTHRCLYYGRHPWRVSKLQACFLRSTQTWAGLRGTWLSRRHLKQP